MAQNKNRCWPGYTAVPSKEPHEQGSCRPKAESKMTDDEKKFRVKRRKQLDKWKSEHPGKSRSAARHLHKSKSSGKMSDGAKRKVHSRDGRIARART